MIKSLNVPLANLKVSFCRSFYLIPKGERLLQNTLLGYIVGDNIFDNCKAGAAFAVGATIVCDQTN